MSPKPPPKPAETTPPPKTEKKSPAGLKPVPDKIGEGHNNLKARSDALKKRRGF